jgi:methyltransferase family protein
LGTTIVALKRLFDRVGLGQAARQSSGPLYEAFLNNARGDLHKWHHYFDVYERHLGRYRGQDFRFLEIGVYRGGSLAMWREYFGPKATIVGLDRDASCARFDGVHGRVRIGDQADATFLRTVLDEFGPFDAVLDDGGHTAHQQLVSFEVLYPELASDGVYLCEDTHTSYWKNFQDSPDFASFTQLALNAANGLTQPLHADPSSFRRYGEAPDKRVGAVQAPLLTAITHGVSFYDSMIVFEKRKKPEPWHEIR